MIVVMLVCCIIMLWVCWVNFVMMIVCWVGICGMNLIILCVCIVRWKGKISLSVLWSFFFKCFDGFVWLIWFNC